MGVSAEELIEFIELYCKRPELRAYVLQILKQQVPPPSVQEMQK